MSWADHAKQGDKVVCIDTMYIRIFPKRLLDQFRVVTHPRFCIIYTIREVVSCDERGAFLLFEECVNPQEEGWETSFHHSGFEPVVFRDGEEFIELHRSKPEGVAA